MDRPPALEKALKSIDSVSVWAGWFSGWLVIPLMAVLVYEVVARKFFLRPTMWASDTSYMLYGSLFMLGASYALYRKAHIRTDFVYRLWSPRVQGTVDALLYLLLFFPGIAFFLWAGWDFAHTSWVQGERTITSPWRAPLYPFKMVIPVAAGLLLLQGISEFLKSVHAALRGEWP